VGGVEIGIEGHRHVSDEESPGRGDHNRIVGAVHPPICLQGVEGTEGIGKMRVEVNAESVFDVTLSDVAAAHHLHDHVAAQPVFGRNADAAVGRKLAGIDPAVVDQQSLQVLHVGAV